MPEASPQLTRQPTAEGTRVLLSGSWSAAQLAEPTAWRRLALALQACATGPSLSWDLHGLQRLDHTGAQVLWNAWGRNWPAQLQASEAQRSVLARVAQYTVPAPEPVRRSAAQRFLHLGAALWQLFDHVRDLLALLGQLLLDTLRLLRAPGKGPWRDLSGCLYQVGATALPITALVGFLIGVVLAYLMSQQLRQFGADVYIVNILGLALIRELGPMLAAVLIAGRSGSAITAQIGVMRVTEELDAMQVMGIARGFRLVLPRALALGLAMPLISVWTTLAALAGGMLAAEMTMGITPGYFLTSLPRVVQVANLWLALGKTVLFGILIAVIGCHFGLRVQPNTESLGRGTTASVVAAITLVILVDALFAIVFKEVGL
jgi:phospholipid/cholesterol/gamma-HCH transport system permease protein